MADDRAVAFCEGDLLVVDDDNHPTHHRSFWPQEWRAFADAQAKAKVKIAAPPDSALDSVATAKECKLDAGAATATADGTTVPSVTTGSDRSDGHSPLRGPLPVQQGMDDATTRRRDEEEPSSTDEEEPSKATEAHTPPEQFSALSRGPHLSPYFHSRRRSRWRCSPSRLLAR